MLASAQVLWPGAQLIAARLLGQRAAGEAVDETAGREAATAGSAATAGRAATAALEKGAPAAPAEKAPAALLGSAAPSAWAGKRVLCVGCGTGLEALAASVGGGAHVVATDSNPLPLALLRLAAADCFDLPRSSGRSCRGGSLRTAFFDILNPANAAPGAADGGSLAYDGPRFGASGATAAAWGGGGGQELLSSCDLLVRARVGVGFRRATRPCSRGIGLKLEPPPPG
jgi:SAM-dependent methyltransferase